MGFGDAPLNNFMRTGRMPRRGTYRVNANGTFGRFSGRDGRSGS